MSGTQLMRIAAQPPFPNNTLPVIVYPGALESPFDFEALFGANGWQGLWTNGVYAFHHFHASAHEVLGVHRGSARLLLGGPQGQELCVRAGDAILLPAGIGHERIEASQDFSVVGAYPPGQAPDMERGDAARFDACVQRIAMVPQPVNDPVYGGPVTHWLEPMREMR